LSSGERALAASDKRVVGGDSMTIDHRLASEIVDSFRRLGPYEAYYRKDEVEMDRLGALVPETSDVLRRAFARSRRVLDVGCGDGRTLLANADQLSHATGIDESEYMIALALRSVDAMGIGHVDFQQAKAVALPFADDAFDMVFSERGPLGHSDATLDEALRVLEAGGLIFVETLGDYDTLGIEKRRFETHGVALQALLARTHTLVFSDFYELLKYQCSNLVYMGRGLPPESDRVWLETMLSQATDASGRISVPYDTIWIAGSKNAALATSTAADGAVRAGSTVRGSPRAS
jgi:ubiquinone/menaquinone biosynthesis C-methylase UbiE